LKVGFDFCFFYWRSFSKHFFFWKKKKHQKTDRVGYFEAFIIKTAEELKEEPFGVEILNTLGYIYEQKAQQYLGENRV